MNFLRFFIVAAVALSGTEARLTAEQLAEIDAAIEGLVMPSSRISGFGIGVVEDGQVTYVKGYGYKNITAESPVEENSLFAVGSISKGITATLVVKVLSEKFPDHGENVLNIPVRKLIPTFNFTLSDRMRTETINFRDLLSHRACLQGNDVHTLIGNDEDKETLIYRLRYLGSAGDFRGGCLAYNNAMITLAGELVAHVSNMTYEQLISEFFTQVNMTDSTYFDKELEYLDLPNLAMPYVKIGDNVVEYNAELLSTIADGNAAGGLLSSPRDMAKYMALHVNRGKVGDVQVISEAAISWVIKNCIPMDPGFTSNPAELYYSNYGYALSYWTALVEGFQMVNHGGYYPPYNSQITWLPGMKVGVFTTSSGPGALVGEYNHMFIHFALGRMVLANGLGRSGHLDVATAVELSRLHKMDFDFSFPTEVDVSQVPSTAQPRRSPKQGTQALAIEDIVGVYGHPAIGDAYVSYDNETGVLLFEYGTWGIGELEPLPEEEDAYRMIYLTDIEMYAYANTWGGDIGQSKILFREGYLEYHGFAGGYRFNKDATLDTYPELPYDPSSCVP